MLIEFSVENFKSIRERQTLSMVASNYYKEMLEENTFEVVSDEKFSRLLKSAVIYGANASGKTSLVDAMSFVDSFVCESAKESQAGDSIEVLPFRLSNATRNADSCFEVSFFQSGVRFEFGFTANVNRVTSEWLHAYPAGHWQKWYSRTYIPESDSYSYVWSKYFLGGRRRSDWKENTRSNALFLSTAVQLNCQQLQPAFDWFKKRIATLDPGQLSAAFTMANFEENKADIMSFLGAADLFIEDIQIEKIKFDPSFIPESMPDALREDVLKRMSGKEFSEPKFFSRSIDDESLIEFSHDEISAGTKALFTFAGPWLDVIRQSRVLFVDELDSSLHPLVVHQLIKILHKEGGNAQVVFTTHDTSILGKNILRRDQIWMVEKDSTQSSVLTPLSDYAVREDEALEKGYLGGRYGGIPFVKDLSIGN